MSGEAAVAPENNEQSLINFNEVQYVNQEAFEDLVRWDLAFRYGDHYGQINTPEDSRNLNSTTKNIFRSLFALKTSFNLIPANLQDRPTIFVRPDLKILSSLDFNTYSSLIFKQKIQRKYGHTDGIALVPNWHSWNGLNDRFAICTPGNASKSYANRYDHLIPYIEFSKHALHPETFLYQIMHACRVEVLAVISTKMARIRANGIPHPEDFSQGMHSYDLQKETRDALIAVEKKADKHTQEAINSLKELRKQLEAKQAELQKVAGERDVLAKEKAVAQQEVEELKRQLEARGGDL